MARRIQPHFSIRRCQYWNGRHAEIDAAGSCPPSLVVSRAALFVASLVAFCSNKVIVAKKKRFELLRKIGELRPQWLHAFDLPPVVWVRATLDLAENSASDSG